MKINYIVVCMVGHNYYSSNAR